MKGERHKEKEKGRRLGQAYSVSCARVFAAQDAHCMLLVSILLPLLGLFTNTQYLKGGTKIYKSAHEGEGGWGYLPMELEVTFQY
jgi:hypothetical protein